MPIVMSKNEWDRLHEWTKSDREEAEVVRRREYIKFLDDTSRQMTKSWPNSVENVNKRNEELRQARLAVAEQANTKFYKRYLRKQKEQQEKLMYSARDVIFKNKDAPKLLLSAVIESATQAERREQVKFLNERRKEDAARKKQEDDDITRKAREWHELMELRKKRRFEVDKKHQKEILEQAHEVAERNRQEYEQEMNLQRMDIVKATQQIEAIDEFEKALQAENKARIFRNMARSREERAAMKREQEARNKMDDRLIEVLINSRCRIEQKRKQTEADIKNEKLRILDKISQRLESGTAARDAKEQAICEKAAKEKNAADDARREADRKRAERHDQEKKESYEQFLRDQQQRLHELNTMHQWSIMNRFKNVEINEDYQERLREEKKRKIQEYREDILRLWKEREDREAKELADKRYFYGELAVKKLRDQDNRLLTHAQHLLQEAHEKGWPDYALKRAIDGYCKMYRLYPMPELPASLQQHYGSYAPWDGSRPDADYQEPLAPQPSHDPKDKNAKNSPERKPRRESPPEVSKASPPPAKKPEPQEVQMPEIVRKNGLQEITEQPGPSRQKEEKVEEVATDYKRAGPANGLQRKILEATLSLPPITVVPCTTESCRCELKKALK